MTLASAQVKLKEAYQENNWFAIALLLLRFGSELLAYLRELQAEKKKESLEKKEK